MIRFTFRFALCNALVSDEYSLDDFPVPGSLPIPWFIYIPVVFGFLSWLLEK